jgi:aminocarboxymuconate-semialdehyde decarboxylase
MIIDFHTHMHAPGMTQDDRLHITVETVLKAARDNGIEVTCVSNPLHDLRRMDRERGLQEVKTLHSYFAKARDRAKDELIAFVTAAPWSGDEYLKEVERAVREDGFKGAIMPSSLKGGYPDDEVCMPFWQLACELDIPVMIHPPAVGFGEERMRDYRLASSIGRPFDNCLAIGRLIVRGIFERFPTLKLVGTHLGGGISEVIGRMDYAYELQEEASFLGPYEPMLIKKKPSEYVKMMYFDSVCYHLPAARCAMETVGIDHFLFGTDAPPLTVLKGPGLQLVRDLKLPSAQEEKVLAGNAKRLLNL